MAKQDLVVKLLLDSGAFGNDLREAERKAQQFSNKIQGAGKTAGDLGKELNITTGALGKLGGVLTGAGAVVAAVGAFKSIMESSHDSAKKFHGVIGGFKGVLESFQYSLSTMDFSSFNRGLKQVYENAKQAQQAILDAKLSTVAYSIVDKDTKLKLKEYEVEYRKKETTAERRKEIEKERDELLDSARITAEAQAENLYTSVLARIVEKNADIGDLEGNLEKTKELIPYNKMRDLMLEASYDLIFNRDEKEKERWDEIRAQLAKLESDAKINTDSAQMHTWHQPPKWLEFLPWVKKSREKWKNQSALDGKAGREAKAEWEKLVKEYQDLMIKNVLYTIGEEGLKTISDDMGTSFDIVTALDDLKLQGMGWTPPTEPTSGGGGGGDEDEYELLVGSIAKLEKDISELEKKRGGMIVGSDDWIKATKNLADLNDQLKTQKKLQEDLDKIFRVIPPPDEVEGSVAALKKLIAEQEKLRDYQVVGSKLWYEHNTLIQQYTKDLKEAEEATEKLNGKMESKPQYGSYGYIQEQMKNFGDIANRAEVGSSTWESAMWMLNYYSEQLETLKKVEEEFTNQFISDEEKKAKAAEKFNEKLENRRAALSATGVVLNGLGDIILAYEDELDEKTSAVLSGVNNLFGDTINGIMSFIQIQQACATATGVTRAAEMPFPYNLAAIASVVGSLASVFANIKQMANASGKFAEGGIVGGTSYSGDKLFAMVNSGEMILNRRQQGNLANMLGGGGQVEFHISGDSLVGVLNNNKNKRNLIR